MKKIIILCAIACCNNTLFGMFTKCSTLSKNKFTHVRKCNNRAQFNFPAMLQQLKEQEQNPRVQEQIKLIEMLITNQPKNSTDAYIAMPDRDFPQGNMHKDH
jgi:hypothetical protein